MNSHVVLMYLLLRLNSYQLIDNLVFIYNAAQHTLPQMVLKQISNIF